MQLPQEEKTSRFRGVTLSGSSEDTKWWTAQLHKHRRKIRVGYSYASEEAAARAYDRACIAINGRGTRTNFPLIAYPEEVWRDGWLGPELTVTLSGTPCGCRCEVVSRRVLISAPSAV